MSTDRENDSKPSNNYQMLQNNIATNEITPEKCTKTKPTKSTRKRKK